MNHKIRNMENSWNPGNLSSSQKLVLSAIVSTEPGYINLNFLATLYSNAPNPPLLMELDCGTSTTLIRKAKTASCEHRDFLEKQNFASLTCNRSRHEQSMGFRVSNNV